MPEDRETSRDYFREWRVSMIGASGALITVPLLALSVITVSSRFTQQGIAYIAIPILISAVLFALSIFLLSLSLRYVGSFFKGRSDKDAAMVNRTTEFGTYAFELGIGFLVVALLVMVFELV